MILILVYFPLEFLTNSILFFISSPPSREGDVIGCVYDPTSCEMHFYINGESQGLAFSGVDATKLWYPACSLGQGQQVRVCITRAVFLSFLFFCVAHSHSHSHSHTHTHTHTHANTHFLSCQHLSLSHAGTVLLERLPISLRRLHPYRRHTAREKRRRCPQSCARPGCGYRTGYNAHNGSAAYVFRGMV